MKKVTPQQLQQDFEPIAHVPEEQLQYLIDKGKQRELAADDFLFRKDEPSDNMTLILSGRIRIYTLQKNQSREIAIVEKGDITGLLPYSRLKTASGYGQALETTHILSFHRKDMPEMIRECYELTEALVHFMSSRIREFTTFQLQNEKMMALGKLSAGLAHELNNPASAIVRSSKELKSHLSHLPQNFKKVISIRMTSEQVDEVNERLTTRLSQPPGKKLSLMERQNLEDDLADCMEEKGVDNAYEV
ncbi:MAG: cyclic nucleotide-binding domain-containing protein, partial [Owenweeksia sp.]